MHTHTHARALGRTLLVEGSARRRDLCLTTHNIHTKQISTPLAGFEPAIPAIERPQTYVLESAATALQLGIHNFTSTHAAEDAPLIEYKKCYLQSSSW